MKAGQAILARTLREDVYSVRVCGHEYAAFPEVFPAHHFPSTRFFTENLTVAAGEEVLEIGSGMGVTAIELALRGAARVVATDISEAAVRNTRCNAEKLGVGAIVEARHGDLFGPVLAPERFDLIYWNIPFVYVPDSFEPALPERSLFDPGYRQTSRFLQQAGAFLKPGGRLSFGFADFGEVDQVEALLAQHSYRWSVVAELPVWEGRPVVYLLYAATLP